MLDCSLVFSKCNDPNALQFSRFLCLSLSHYLDFFMVSDISCLDLHKFRFFSFSSLFFFFAWLLLLKRSRATGCHFSKSFQSNAFDQALMCSSYSFYSENVQLDVCHSSIKWFMCFLYFVFFFFFILWLITHITSYAISINFGKFSFNRFALLKLLFKE